MKPDWSAGGTSNERPLGLERQADDSGPRPSNCQVTRRVAAMTRLSTKKRTSTLDCAETHRTMTRTCSRLSFATPRVPPLNGSGARKALQEMAALSAAPGNAVADKPVAPVASA